MVRHTARTPDSALYRQLNEGWGPHEENTARLYEALHYWLELAWVDRTTDPDDPAVKRERALAKRNGIKPPEHPLIPPVALRPPEMSEQRLQEYIEELEQYQTDKPDQGGTRHVSSSEFDRMLGL